MNITSRHVRTMRPNAVMVTIILGLRALTTSAQVVINEIMPAPRSPEPEWVELYNASRDSVVLQGVYLYDATSKSPLPETIMPPETYVVLCKDTTALRTSRFIPPSATLVRITLPSLNNTGEVLRLATKDSLAIDSIVYSMAWGTSGQSLERIDPRRPLLSADNCKPCIAASGATCGSDNSVSPRDGDVSLVSLNVQTPERRLVAIVRNMGATHLAGVVLSMRIDTILLLTDTLSLEAFEERAILLPLDSIANRIDESGRFDASAAAHIAGDPRPMNDALSRSIVLAPPQGSIRISEILYDPSGAGAGAAEFVEIVNADSRNRSTEGVHLRIDEEVIPLEARILEPGDVLAVTCDSIAQRIWTTEGRAVGLTSQTFTLRSTWDSVLVTDAYGLVIDSVCYSSDWHSPHVGLTKGRSLEKRSPVLRSAAASSWTSSVDTAGCTPGLQNSVSRRLDSGAVSSASPNPFSPHSTRGDRQSTVLRFVSPFSEAVWTIRLFDTHGRELGTLRNGEYLRGDASAVWEGRNERGDVLPVGPYVVSCQAVDATSGAVFTHSIVVVIADS